MSLGLMKSQGHRKSGEAVSLSDAFAIQATDSTCVDEENFLCEIDSLKEEERQLLIERKRLIENLDRLQVKFHSIFDRKSRIIEELEKKLSSIEKNGENRADHVLFLVVTCGSSWTDELVFTVLAENDVWAAEIVRQWLNSNGRENHRIDKVLAVVSRDVRGIVNVGAKLLDV